MDILLICAVLLAIPLVLIAIAVHNAPDGYEDDSGFHYVRKQ